MPDNLEPGREGGATGRYANFRLTTDNRKPVNASLSDVSCSTCGGSVCHFQLGVRSYGYCSTALKKYGIS